MQAGFFGTKPYILTSMWAADPIESAYSDVWALQRPVHTEHVWNHLKIYCAATLTMKSLVIHYCNIQHDVGYIVAKRCSMHMQHPERFFLYQILILSYHDAVITVSIHWWYSPAIAAYDLQLHSMHPKKRSNDRAE